MGEHRQSRDWANKQQRTSQTRSNQVCQLVKKTSVTSKVLFKNQRQPIVQARPSMHQSNRNSTRHHPPWGAHLGRANAPAVAPGPGRSEDQAWQDETILHDWHGTKNMVISSYQKSANPSRSRRKNLSRNEKSNDTTNENRLCRRLADTRDLKSFSEDRVWGCPRWRHWKSQNCSLTRMIVGLSFCSAFWKLWRDERNHSCTDNPVWTRLQEPFYAGLWWNIFISNRLPPK